MAAFTFFNQFKEALAEKIHNLGSDTLTVALSNAAPNVSTNTVLADITQIANGNGYVTGGSNLTTSSSAQTAGTYKLVVADLTFTASGGTMATFRYAIYYNNTATNDELIGYVDYGSAVSLLVGEQFTLDHDASGGLLTLA